MAENVTIRDEFFKSLEDGSKWDVGVSINRTNPLPLDQYSVFKTETDLDNYIAGAFAYPGQILAVVGENETVIYYLDQNKQKQEVGSMPGVDNKSIKITTVNDEEVLTLVGLDTATAGASLIKLDDGSIGWSSTTQEGLSADLTGIKTNISTLNTTVYGSVDGKTLTDDGLVNKVSALETKFDEMGGVFNFAGSFTSGEFANQFATNYDIGDVVLVNGKDEYLCVEKTTTTYKLTEDISIVEGKKYFIKTKDKEEYTEVNDFGDVTVPSAADYYEINSVTKTKVWEQFGDPDGIELLRSDVDGHTTKITGLETKVSTLETVVGSAAKPESSEGADDAKAATGLYAYVDEVATNKAIAAKMEAEADAAAALKIVSDKVDKNTGDITTLNTTIALKANSADVEIALAKKVNLEEYLPRINELEEKVSAKEDTITVIDRLALKVDKSTYDTAIETINATVGGHTTKISSLEGIVGKVSLTPDVNSTGLIGRIENLESTDTTHGQDIKTLKQTLGSADDDSTKSSVFGKIAAAHELASAAKTAAESAQSHSESVLGTDKDEATANTVFGAKAAAAAAQNKADAVEKLVTGDNAKVNQSTYDAKVKEIEEDITAHDTAIETINNKIGTLGNVMNFVGELEEIGEEGKKVLAIKLKEGETEENRKTPEDGDVGYFGTFEYVYLNGKWEKFGDTSAESGRISTLETTVGTETIYKKDAEGNLEIDEATGKPKVEREGTGLIGDVEDLKAEDVAINALITKLNTDFFTALEWGFF